MALAIQSDDLHKYEMAKRKDAEYCILTAAKLIAPFIEGSLNEGTKQKHRLRILLLF